MNDENKTKEQLLQELKEIRKKVSERKKAEEALKESERQLSEIQSIGAIGIWEMNVESQKVTWSEQTYNLYERDPALGTPTFEEIMTYYDREESKEMQKKIRRAIEFGEEYEMDHYLKLPSEKTAYHHAEVKVKKDKNGTVIKLFGTVQDITERKKAERALLESEEKYRSIFESSPLGITHFDTDSTITDCNEGLLQLSGSSREKIIGLRLRDIYKNHKEELFALEEALSGRVGIFKGDHLMRNGNTLTIKTIYSPIFSENKIIVGGFTLTEDISIAMKAEEALQRAHDKLGDKVRERTAELSMIVKSLQSEITERKRAEAQINESAEKFRSIFESSNDAIMLLDKKGFFDCNESTLRIFGCSCRDEFLGKHPSEWSPTTQPDGSDSREAAEEKIATAFRKGRNFFEWMHWRANGKEFPAEVLLTPMQLEGIDVLQATVRDITERKRVEEELELKSQELEALTQDLRKLSTQLSEQEELSRRKFARILHEQVGQDLAAIKIQCSEILKEHCSDKPKMEKTISLTLSILENAIRSTRTITADLYPVVLDRLGFIPAISWYSDLILKPKKLKVTMNIDKSVESLSPKYKLSFFRIVQEAFHNIIKHASATEVDIVLKKVNRSIQLIIKDDGVGIDFKKVEKKKDKGIGLMLIKERALSLGGDFKVECAFNKGTKLVIEIPIKQ